MTTLVLDTNVVLDCFVFRDPATSELLAALQSHRVQALVHEYAIAELRRVLTYPQCRLDVRSQADVLDRYLATARHAVMPDGFTADTLLLPPGFPRCRDPDDDPFLALAFHARADGLVTKDRALLKLRRKARKFGVTLLALADLKVNAAIASFPASMAK